MNNKELNIALGKLFNGIELDTHKVDLAIQDEVKRLYSDYIDANEEYDRIYSPISQVRNDLKSWISKREKIQNKAEALYKKTDKAIKELGVNRNTYGLLDDLDKIKKDKIVLAHAESTLKSLLKML
tara:strand:+ start:1043 stop:1420 length:378 start_codon:yes stop_codon:yes gene_type:complete